MTGQGKRAVVRLGLQPQGPAREAIKRRADEHGLLPAYRRLKALTIPAARHAAVDAKAIRLLFACCLSRDSNCIDVGANVGSVLDDMVRLAPAGRHHAFEPLPSYSDRLAERHPAVEVHNVALGDRSGEASFHYVRSRPAFSGLKERPYPAAEHVETINVRTARLDDVLPTGYVPDLLKIDVEGAEREVLVGSMETIARHRPIVVFEHEPDACSRYGTDSAEIHALLCREAGLSIFDLDGGGPHDRSGFQRAAQAAECRNFVARRYEL